MQSEKAKLEWIEYELLEEYPHVVHGAFTRHGGVSEGHFGTLNLGEGTSDKPERVKFNRELVRKMFDLKHLVFPHEVHGTIVHRVTTKNLDKIPQCDALFTTEKEIGIGVTHADCQGVIFYDQVHEAIAVAHCGWRGSAQNIYARVVDTMNREIGTQAHNLIVCVSPSLGPDHAEFKNYKQELPQEFWEYQIKPNYFDFWGITKMQLDACGIPEKNIEMAQTCTFCSDKDYFSYRREKDTGRNATVVALKS